MEKTLMHTCCAPCSVACIHQLRSEGIEPVAYWFNLNMLFIIFTLYSSDQSIVFQTFQRSGDM